MGLAAFIAMDVSFFAIRFTPIVPAMVHDAVACGRARPVYPVGLAIFAAQWCAVAQASIPTWRAAAFLVARTEPHFGTWMPVAGAVHRIKRRHVPKPYDSI